MILGSGLLDLLRQSGESWDGRIAYVNMGLFDILETAAANSEDAAPLWVRGGFSESYLAADDRKSLRWRRDFIRSYLEREVPLFGPRAPAGTLEHLRTMLAHEQGNLLNVSRPAQRPDGQCASREALRGFAAGNSMERTVGLPDQTRTVSGVRKRLPDRL